jgi:putative transcriptional regulator
MCGYNIVNDYIYIYNTFRRCFDVIQLKIKELLEGKKVTMYWLSKQTGISPNNISNLLNNKTRSITFETLEKIYTALGCESFDEILEYLPEKDKQ